MTIKVKILLGSTLWLISFRVFPEGHIESVNLGGNYKFYMVQGLHAGTEYTISINPVFVDVEGPVTSSKTKTCE